MNKLIRVQIRRAATLFSRVFPTINPHVFVAVFFLAFLATSFIFNKPAFAAPTNLNIFAPPSCSDGPYTLVLEWNGLGSGWWVDLTNDSSFVTYWHKQIVGADITNQYTAAPGSFDNIFLGQLTLNPDTTYYWRIWDGFTHTPGPNFSVVNCTGASFTIRDVFHPAKIPGFGNETGFGALATDIITILIGLAFTISIIFIIIGGIKIVTASGDPKKLSSAQQTVLYAIIGLAVTVLAFVILQVVQYFLRSGVPITS